MKNFLIILFMLFISVSISSIGNTKEPSGNADLRSIIGLSSTSAVSELPLCSPQSTAKICIAKRSQFDFLRSTDQNQILFVYDIVREMTEAGNVRYYASNMQVNARLNKARPSGNEKIRVVLTNQPEEREGIYSAKTMVLDLVYSATDLFQNRNLSDNSGRLNASDNDFRTLLIHEDHAGRVEPAEFKQYVSVVIDGKWQKDPINGTHNFQVDMSLPR